MAKKGLGKGLGALLGDKPVEEVIYNEKVENASGNVVELKIIDVEPNKQQPRQKFDDDSLEELAASIREHGVISPIIVTKSENGFYKIVAGERRWRAAKKAALKTIPAVIKNLDELEIQEIALIENLQRQDLNPVEEALGYKKLMDDFMLTQEQIAAKMGKSRSSIANSLRILNLPEDVIGFLHDGKISFGHAKVILSCENKTRQSEIAKEIIKGDLSVRATEQLVKAKPKTAGSKPKTDLNLKLAFEAIEKSMSSALNTKVVINDRGNKGTIQIEYYSSDELQRLTEILNKL